MDEPAFEELLHKVGPLITKQDAHLRDSIPAAERLALTLRFLASGEDIKILFSGDSFTSLQYLYWIPKSTISAIVPEVCEAIFQVLVDEYLKVPQSAEEWEEKANEFETRWQFFNCIGAIDGKHIVIQAPANSGSYYFNYKGTYSIVLLALVDADYKFTYVDVGQNGRASDGGVYKTSTLAKALETGELNITSKCQLPGTDKLVPYVFVGDDAFPLNNGMMKP
ncbi:uncharacterized protein LOC135495272 [Lineus longissimus]|uniref:uncharacterized protein LOC135495272 n=1 Tax=Lineus longissimus TaxID=88925 RepID=UPI00315C7125